MEKTRDKNCDLFFLVCYSFFSIASFSFLPVNISYVFSVFFIFIIVVLVVLSKKIGKDELKLTLYSILIFFVQVYGYHLARAEIGSLLSVDMAGGAYLSILLFFFSCLSCPIPLLFFDGAFGFNKQFFLRGIRIFCLLLNFYFIIELLVRLVNPDLSEHGIYVFKNSLFYLDSNFVGLVLLSYYHFLNYLKRRHLISNVYSRVLVFFLIALTFSRAVWLGLFFYHVAVHFYHNGCVNTRRLKLCFLLYLFVSIGLLSAFVLLKDYIFLIDQSFYSKFILFERALNLYTETELILKITGSGLASSSEFFGKYLHNIYAIFMIEFGVLPAITFVFMLVKINEMSTGQQLPLTFIFVLSGFSLFSPYMPFFFFFSSLIIHLERIKEQ